MIKRQGDVLVVKVDKIPESAIKVDSRILAEGEAAGHLHELDLGEVYEDGDVLYFRVPADKKASLNHPEHKVISFDAGEYKVVRQREYIPDGWKTIRD